MKAKLILLLGAILSLQVIAVENSANNVESEVFPCTKYAKYCDPVNHEPPVNFTINYSCVGAEGNSFKLVEQGSAGLISEYQGSDLYEDGQLKLVTKQQGVLSTKTTFQFPSGAALIVSEKAFLGKGGGRGGFDSPLIKSISAKLTTNEKDYYFNCF